SDEEVARLLNLALSDDLAQSPDEPLQTRLGTGPRKHAAPQGPPPLVSPPSSQALPPLASPTPQGRKSLKRLVRPALGVGLLALAAWALVPLLIDVRSRQAAVNAPRLIVCSPIGGTVRFLCATDGGASACAD